MNEHSHCVNEGIFKTLESTLDRLKEAEWFIHMMEEKYHNADQFRWSLNSFLRSLKEVLKIVEHELQGNKEIVDWLRVERSRLYEDPLLSFLFKQRDIVVHKNMLKPASKGSIGFSRGKGMKIALGIPIDPLDDSDMAIMKYINFAARQGDVIGILYMEDDGGGEYTCVQREWRLKKFPDTELTKLAAEAWERLAKFIFQTAKRLGAQLVEMVFDLGDRDLVQIEMYRPEWIKKEFEKAKLYALESPQN